MDTKNADTAEGSSSGKPGGAWTDAERNQFLLRVLASVLPEGKGVDWKKVNMPNRTPKSLQHQWTTVVAQMRDLNVGGDGALPAKPRTPRKKAVSKKAVAKAAAEGDDGEDDGEDDGKDGEEEKKKPVTPKKRGAAANSGEGSAKKRRAPAKKTPATVKPEEDDEHEQEVVVKGEVEDEGSI